MSTSPRYLTKSRFKMGIECPTRLHYTGKAEYVDRSVDDSFLAALAEGGYQVGALACLMYPGGVEVTDHGHAAQLATTHELLQREEVTIYEAALQAQGLFVRVDILRKRGRLIELIEVKAKSYEPAKDAGFRNARGALRSDWLPYLQDIAFQRHVAGLALPDHEFECFLMVADKSRAATVDGLNQRFRVRRQGRAIDVALAPDTDATTLGEPILTAVPVDEQVRQILTEPLTLMGTPVPFEQAVAMLGEAYRDDRKLGPVPGAMCGECPFQADQAPAPGEPRSGFHECWTEAFGLSEADFEGGTVLDLWNFRGKDKLIQEKRVRLQEVGLDDLGFDGSAPGTTGLTRAHRQWYQVQADWPGGGEFFIDTAGLAEAMRGWRYPLHFIDFETSAVAIPFSRGHRPYETVAFQFSHHVMERDGSVRHASQFLLAEPGVDPTLPFIRALRDAVGGDNGTIFRWATHENTVLNHLRRRLLADPAPLEDRDGLAAFIESITTREEDGERAEGPRAMVDLCKLAERYYFHPSSLGSSSLKRVLPALMRSSPALRLLYGQAVYATAAMPSLNLTTPMIWWVECGGQVMDPYDLLPPVFAEVGLPEQKWIETGVADSLQEGGAAMAAYARLQFEEIDPREREAIRHALLRYCELDTLAMVMAVQAWTAWTDRL